MFYYSSIKILIFSSSISHRKYDKNSKNPHISIENMTKIVKTFLNAKKLENKNYYIKKNKKRVLQLRIQKHVNV